MKEQSITTKSAGTKGGGNLALPGNVTALTCAAGVLVLKSIEDRASKLVLLVSIEYAKFRRPVGVQPRVPGLPAFEVRRVRQRHAVARVLA